MDIWGTGQVGEGERGGRESKRWDRRVTEGSMCCWTRHIIATDGTCGHKDQEQTPPQAEGARPLTPGWSQERRRQPAPLPHLDSRWKISSAR